MCPVLQNGAVSVLKNCLMEEEIFKSYILKKKNPDGNKITKENIKSIFLVWSQYYKNSLAFFFSFLFSLPSLLTHFWLFPFVPIQYTCSMHSSFIFWMTLEGEPPTMAHWVCSYCQFSDSIMFNQAASSSATGLSCLMESFQQ